MRRLAPLDRVRLGLFALGLLFTATGALPFHEADATVRRILPILLFLATVIVLAELAARAEVFDVIATRMAIAGRGRYPLLFGLCVGFAAFVTVTLNIDTTAVLLTPIMLALADRALIAMVPLAMTTVWLANTASLLLPVSNLTNLLAANRVALPAVDFARRMWAPELASVLATMAVLWVCFWRAGRRGAATYDPPRPLTPRSPALCWISAAACLLFIAATLAGVTLGIASAVAAAVVVAAFAVGEREALSWSLIPWRLLVFVTGLFLVVQTVSVHGLDHVVRALMGTGGGTLGVWRAAGTGTLLSNGVNNLPAYVAGEAVVPGGNHTQLLGLLIGVNVGPVILPWASLANLIWHERCEARGVKIPRRTTILTGALLAVTAVPAAVAALLAT